MLKKIAERVAFGRPSWDPIAYWRKRAGDPATQSVMWQNLAYNDLVDRDEWAVIEKHLPDRRGAVLDLGCGTGRLSARLAARFESYTGVDLDTMVAEAARRNPSLADRFVASTVQDYAYPDRELDLVLTIGVLATACSRSALPAVLRRIAGSLRAGGRLLLLEGFHEHPLLTRGCRITPRAVTKHLEAFGMRLDALDGILFFPTRMVLSEKIFERFPRATEHLYRAGERAVRLSPSRLADYGVIAMTKL